MTKAACVVFASSLLLTSAQETETPVAKGVIYGSVTDASGNVAGELNLRAVPLGVPLAAALPHTRTDRNGAYKFEGLSWWGRYTVYADDLSAGYSDFSRKPAERLHPKEVTISPEDPRAELNFQLPPKAGFLHVHLINEADGTVISSLMIEVMSQGEPNKLLFSESCDSTRPVLVPPDENLAIHITSPGFHEWVESAGKGRFLLVGSGEQVELDVPLSPSR